MPGERFCGGCQTAKPVAEFSVLRSGQPNSQCKRCCCDRASRHRVAAGEAGRAKRRAGYAVKKAELATALAVLPDIRTPSVRLNLIRSQKACCTCGNLKPLARFSMRPDKRSRMSECLDCSSERSKDWYYDNTERALASNRINILRKQVVLKLGCRCANPLCLIPGGCTDVRALQIDHVNNDGAAERKMLGGELGPKGGQRPLPQSKMAAIYALALEDVDGRYQLLCANCNVIKEHERRQEKYRQRRENRNATS